MTTLFAKRVVLFRDGHVVEDHAVERPKDAAALAAQLRAEQIPGKAQA